MSGTGLIEADQIARMHRIEAIFQPAARRAREAKREKDNPGVPVAATNQGKFVHYTSAESALRIIESKRLWMRSTTCMADYREVHHGHSLLFRYFSSDIRKAAFYAAVDGVHAGIATATLQLFDQWWRNISLNTFIASVSDHDVSEDRIGRLSMWRAFGASPRVALVFSIPWYSDAARSLNLAFGPVFYRGEAAADTLLDEAVASIAAETAFLKSLSPDELKGQLFAMLINVVCCSKHEGFHEEREWRGVYTPAFGPGLLLDRETRVIAGVPQEILKVPFDATRDPSLAILDMSAIIDRLIIGPTQYGWVMYTSFVDALRKIGVADPDSKVWVSDLPIR